MTTTDSTICLVGCGNMGSAMLRGWLSSGIDASSITIIDPHLSDSIREFGTHYLSSPDQWPGGRPDIIILAVKPNISDLVLSSLVPLVDSTNVILSIVAGKRISFLSRYFSDDIRVIRAMPNTPSQVLRSMTVCVDNGRVDESQKLRVTDLLSSIGIVEWITDESLMDAVTAVSGSGPAYIFHFCESLALAGEKAGLPRDLSEKLAIHTVSGSGELLLRSDISASELRENVTSPGGTTQKALEILMDSQSGLSILLERAVSAARIRSQELGEDPND